LLAPSLERRRLQCYLALIVSDIAAIVFGYVAIAYVHLGESGPAAAFEVSQLSLPIYLTIALYNNAYSREALQNPWYGIWRAEIALFIMTASIILIAFLTKSSGEFSRVTVAGGGF